MAHFFASAGVLEAGSQKPRIGGPDPVEQASAKRLAVGLREHAVALQAFCVKVSGCEDLSINRLTFVKLHIFALLMILSTSAL